ncbi:hypothetical protein PINS_up002101 [Pythium insidiosum]|nr:hypothetical protein PINS_up002101 [Pythium insidiosum]
MRLLLLLSVALLLWNGAQAFAADRAVTRRRDPSISTVVVPNGVTTVLHGARTTQRIECDVLVDSVIRVELTVIDGTSDKHPDMVSPQVVEFRYTNNASESTLVNATAAPQRQVRLIDLIGRVEGRFYLTYMLSGDTDRYRLSALSSVLSVSATSQGWRGIWYELGFNVTLFAIGLAFFVWRRLHRVNLPLWEGHRVGLFERANTGDLPLPMFEKRYREILGDSLRARMRLYCTQSCVGAFVCNACGVPAALLLQFHLDAGHLCAMLSVLSVGCLLPIVRTRVVWDPVDEMAETRECVVQNYLSGNAHTSLPGNSFQQTTLSNVPLLSDWYWAHVAYCYAVALLVISFLTRYCVLLCFAT